MKDIVKVSNVYTGGHHYLIHVLFKDLSSKDLHAYSTESLNKLINELYNNSKVYDYYVYVGIDFDLEVIGKER